MKALSGKQIMAEKERKLKKKEEFGMEMGILG